MVETYIQTHKHKESTQYRFVNHFCYSFIPVDLTTIKTSCSKVYYFLFQFAHCIISDKVLKGSEVSFWKKSYTGTRKKGIKNPLLSEKHSCLKKYNYKNLTIYLVSHVEQQTKLQWPNRTNSEVEDATKKLINIKMLS